MKKSEKRRRSNRRGNVVVLSVFVIVIVLGMVAFGVDVGLMSQRRTMVQNATDAATLAAVGSMADGETAALDAVNFYLENNGIVVDEAAGDELVIEYGTWDQATQTFTVVEDFDDAESMRVSVRLVDRGLTFGQFLGHDTHDVTGSAIALRSGGPPRDIMMVIDCSGSMSNSLGGSSRIEVTKDAAQGLVDELNDEDRVGLTVYSWKDPADGNRKTGRLEEAWDTDHEPTSSRVGQLSQAFYTGGTNIAGGMRAAFDSMEVTPRDEDDDEVEKVMVLLTDGQANKNEPAEWWDASWPHYNGSWDPDDDEEGMLIQATRAYANEFFPNGVTIHCVAIGVDSDEMEEIAATFGGNYQRIDSPGELMSFFQEIGQGSGVTLVH